jgi:quinol monooxygenase YgiN
MSVTVVATFTPKPGAGPRIVDAFRKISPEVHQEQGCEIYACNVESPGERVVMVESWASYDDLEAHANGEPLQKLRRLTDPHVQFPYDVIILDPLVLGDPLKGSLL